MTLALTSLEWTRIDLHRGVLDKRVLIRVSASFGSQNNHFIPVQWKHTAHGSFPSLGLLCKHSFPHHNIFFFFLKNELVSPTTWYLALGPELEGKWWSPNVFLDSVVSKRLLFPDQGGPSAKCGLAGPVPVVGCSLATPGLSEQKGTHWVGTE